jgi:hypothetical protein
MVVPLVELWTNVFNFLFDAPSIPLCAQVTNQSESEILLQ